MRDPFNWSLSLGRPFGIQVRLHLIMILYVAAVLLRDLLQEGWGEALGLAAMALVLLFASVLLHEFGHCFAAVGVGGRPDHILMWPLGGLAYVDAPQTPRVQMRVALGGPAVSLGLAVVSGAAIWLLGLDFDWRPWAGAWRPGEALGANALTILCRVNQVLLLFNLLPAFPLDGGRVFQCILWNRSGFSRATLAAVQVGKISAIGLALVGIISVSQANPYALMLVLVALFIYLQCEQTRVQVQNGMLEDLGPLGPGVGFDETDAESPRPGWLARRREQRRERRLERERRQAADEERQVDEILEKLHREGMDRLTDREKATLVRASGRLRDQQRGRQR